MTDHVHRRIVLYGVVVAIAIGLLAVPAAAHEVESDGGYEFVFGADDEPMITGERMWLETEVTDAETGEPVEDLGGDLSVTIHRDDGDETRTLDMEAQYGEDGWYEAPVIFTAPGEYAFVVEGTIDGEDVRVEFSGDHFEVADHTELYFPDQEIASDSNDPGEGAGDDGGDEDDDQESSALGSGFGAVAVLAAALTGAALLARRR